MKRDDSAEREARAERIGRCFQEVVRLLEQMRAETPSSYGTMNEYSKVLMHLTFYLHEVNRDESPSSSRES